jgi:hypothetical protein
MNPQDVERLADLERRVSALENAQPKPASDDPPAPVEPEVPAPVEPPSNDGQ